MEEGYYFNYSSNIKTYNFLDRVSMCKERFGNSPVSGSLNVVLTRPLISRFSVHYGVFSCNIRLFLGLG